jgi:CubicO group peptidase (beta-lactamase class C family)
VIAPLETVSGRVAPGFEPVATAFRQNFAAEREAPDLGAAFVLLRDGEAVVDLVGGYRDPARQDPWTRDTLVNVYSTTKAVTALAIAALVERGHIAYDTAVADFWPAFAAAGKDSVTVGQLLSHQAGLAGFREPVSLEALYDSEARAAQLAAQTPWHPPGADTCYHPMTFGFLADGLVRAATGRDLSSWVSELFDRSGEADCYLGCPRTEAGRVATLVPPPAADLSALANAPPDALAALTNPAVTAEAAATKAWREASLPAANGHASAAGLARLLAIVASGGRLDGEPLLGEETLAGLCRVRSERPDRLLQLPLAWCAGLLRNTAGLYGPRPEVYGHSGWGGSFACADPGAGIAFAYVCNRMGSDLVGDPRSSSLCRAVYECAGLDL